MNAHLPISAINLMLPWLYVHGDATLPSCCRSVIIALMSVQAAMKLVALCQRHFLICIFAAAHIYGWHHPVFPWAEIRRVKRSWNMHPHQARAYAVNFIDNELIRRNVCSRRLRRELEIQREIWRRIDNGMMGSNGNPSNGTLRAYPACQARNDVW